MSPYSVKVRSYFSLQSPSSIMDFAECDKPGEIREITPKCRFHPIGCYAGRDRASRLYAVIRPDREALSGAAINPDETVTAVHFRLIEEFGGTSGGQMDVSTYRWGPRRDQRSSAGRIARMLGAQGPASRRHERVASQVRAQHGGPGLVVGSKR